MVRDWVYTYYSNYIVHIHIKNLWEQCVVWNLTNIRLLKSSLEHNWCKCIPFLYLVLSSPERGHQTHPANLYSTDLHNGSVSKWRHACFHTWAAVTPALPANEHVDTWDFFPMQNLTHIIMMHKQRQWEMNRVWDLKWAVIFLQELRVWCMKSAAAWHHTVHGNEKCMQSHGRPDRCFSADGPTASFICRLSVGYSGVQGPHWTLTLLIESKNCLWWVNKTIDYMPVGF